MDDKIWIPNKSKTDKGDSIRVVNSGKIIYKKGDYNSFISNNEVLHRSNVGGIVGGVLQPVKKPCSFSDELVVFDSEDVYYINNIAYCSNESGNFKYNDEKSTWESVSIYVDTVDYYGTYSGTGREIKEKYTPTLNTDTSKNWDIILIKK